MTTSPNTQALLDLATDRLLSQPLAGQLWHLAARVLAGHDREHTGVARFCDVQACREAWEVLQ